MRQAEVRAGQQCLRPEVCRTYNFGERGSSGGQFYYRYLVPIRLNTADVAWQKKVRCVCT
jgi:alpha-1,3-mannosyl-glycoprotein beta-1,2-N-acetylglucosaminyltransferase